MCVTSVHRALFSILAELTEKIRKSKADFYSFGVGVSCHDNLPERSGRVLLKMSGGYSGAVSLDLPPNSAGIVASRITDQEKIGIYLFAAYLLVPGEDH